MKSCALTGCRPKSFSFGYDEQHTDCHRLKAVLRQQIQGLYEAGFKKFFTGCTVGVELWAGEIVVDLMRTHSDIQLFCVVPFEEQANHWNIRDRERYFLMLDACTKAILIQTRYSNDCYAKQNKYLVDCADILLSVCDPIKNRRSVTAMAVKYARSRRVPVIFIHPATFEVTPDLRLLRP